MDTEWYYEKTQKRGYKPAAIAGLFCLVLVAVIVWTCVVIPEINYKSAIKAMNTGNYIQAYEELITNTGHKNSAEMADTIFQKYCTQRLAKISTGDVIYLGKYNSEALTWTVASIRNGYAILVCNTIVAENPYNNQSGGMDPSSPSYHYNVWQRCSLREWLNNTFVNQAFNNQERSILKQATVPSAGECKNEGKVSDYVYILSRAEMDEAINAGWDADHAIRDYALWLRGSAGTNGTSAQGYNTGVSYGNSITYCHGIVPVIWISANTSHVVAYSAFDGIEPAGPLFDSVKPQEEKPSGGTLRVKCSRCDGKGKIVVKWYSEGDWGEVSYSSYTCTACNGRGYT